MCKTLYIIIFSVAIYSNIYANLNVSNKSAYEDEKKDDIIEIEGSSSSDYTMDKDSTYIIIDGNNIIDNANNIAMFEYIPPIEIQKSDPFRYTEVSFFIAFPFIYTYALLAISGFDALETIIPTNIDRTAYKQLETSELLFTFIGATVAAAAVAYGNYSRVYGKKSKESQLSISFVPVIQTIGHQTGAGFLFTFSYPYNF